MDFSLSEEQRVICELSRKILQEQVDEQRLRELDAATVGERFDRALWRQLADAGLLGIAISPQYGGMGYDFFSLSLLLEEVGRSVAAVPAANALVAGSLMEKFASEEQCQRCLPALVSGEVLLSLALSEAAADSARRPQRLRANLDGERLTLSGSKHYIPYAADADVMIVSAALHDEGDAVADGDGGVCLVLLDAAQLAPYLTPIVTTNGEPQCLLECDALVVDRSAILGGDLKRQSEALHYAVNAATTACCAVQLGAADAALRMTAKYTGERKQFNVPIATFQAVAHRAADAYIDIECLRLCSQQAASLIDQPIADAEAQRAVDAAVSMAKIAAGDTGHRVSYSAQQLHGGTGVDRDYPLWRYCLLLRQMEFTLGSSQQQLHALGEQIAEHGVDMV